MDPSDIFGAPLDGTNNEIRLLLIHSGGGDELIKCTMLRASLEATYIPVRFNAISYVWGNPMDTTTISVDGQVTVVRKNVEGVLRHLINSQTAELKSLPVWIDALCINQDDVLERNQQVNIMADIYRHAESVIVWLE